MRRFFALLAVALVVAAGSGRPAAAAADHNPIIVSPKDGAVVSSPVTVTIDLNGAAVAGHSGGMNGMSGMAGMPAGSGAGHHGHAHLIVDSPLPKPGSMVPMDARHIHMTGGATKKTLTLTPGKHTLQLIMGGDDHVVPPDAPRSTRVTITVR